MESSNNIEKKETNSLEKEETIDVEKEETIDVEKEETIDVEKEETIDVEKEETSNVVVIDFMAEWCGPCKMQDPVIEEMKKKFEGKVTFKKVDVDDNNELANKYKIMAVPTLIVEKDGNVFKKYVGLTKAKELEKTINDALK